MRRKSIGMMILVLIFTATFWFSSKPAEESVGQSSGLLVKLRIVTQEEMDNMTPRYEFLGNAIRKVAHFGLYAIAGVGAFMVTGSTKKSVIIVCLMGGFDEAHQYFVPGRGAQLRDVILDTSGGAAGAALAAFIEIRQTTYRSRLKLSKISK